MVEALLIAILLVVLSIHHRTGEPERTLRTMSHPYIYFVAFVRRDVRGNMQHCSIVISSVEKADSSDRIITLKDTAEKASLLPPDSIILTNVTLLGNIT